MLLIPGLTREKSKYEAEEKGRESKRQKQKPYGRTASVLVTNECLRSWVDTEEKKGKAGLDGSTPEAVSKSCCC